MLKTKTYTPEDFFKLTERLNEYKFEYANGQIYPVQSELPLEESFVDYVLSPGFQEKEIKLDFIPMPTLNHDIITSNLQGHLFLHLYTLEPAVKVYSQGTTVFISFTGNGRVPDVVVSQLNTEKRNEKHQILNPLIIFEVLSPSTRNKDFTEKLEEYQSIESLKDYVLIEQDKIAVRHYKRIDANRWEMELLDEAHQELKFSGIDFKILLEAIYKNVSLKS